MKNKKENGIKYCAACDVKPAKKMCDECGYPLCDRCTCSIADAHKGEK